MAAIEMIEGEEYANVTDPVGSTRAINNGNDVMVVQALLKTIALHSKWYDQSRIPEPNETFDKATDEAIKAFQKHAQTIYGNRRFVSQDGRVSRAQGKMEWGTNCIWTIIAMNSQANIALASYGYEDMSPIDYICLTWKQVNKALKRFPVGDE